MNSLNKWNFDDIFTENCSLDPEWNVWSNKEKHEMQNRKEMDFKGNLNRWRRCNIRAMFSPVSPQDLSSSFFIAKEWRWLEREILCATISSQLGKGSGRINVTNLPEWATSCPHLGAGRSLLTIWNIVRFTLIQISKRFYNSNMCKEQENHSSLSLVKIHILSQIII